MVTDSLVVVVVDRILAAIKLGLVLAEHLRPMAEAVAAAGTAVVLEMATLAVVEVLLTYPASLDAPTVTRVMYSVILR